MTFVELKPMLRTWNIRETILFYTDVLGFTCQEYIENCGWAHLHRDGIALMLSRPNEHEGDTAPCFTGSIYITCDDADALWVAVRDRVKVCCLIEDFDHGMREFGIYDNKGYLLQVGMPCTPVGLFEIGDDRGREAIQTGECIAKCRLLTRLALKIQVVASTASRDHEHASNADRIRFALASHR